MYRILDFLKMGGGNHDDLYNWVTNHGEVALRDLIHEYE